MKRLIASSEIQIGDKVVWKKHPYDISVYEVKEILENGNLFMDNGESSHTDIKPSVVIKL